MTVERDTHLEAAVADGGDEALRPEPDRVAQCRADCPPDAAVLALELVPGVATGCKRVGPTAVCRSAMRLTWRSCLLVGLGWQGQWRSRQYTAVTRGPDRGPREQFTSQHEQARPACHAEFSDT